MVKKIAVFLLALLLISALTVTALAHPVPDLTQHGSITFKMDLGENALDGGNLNIYKVGKVIEDDGNIVFAPILEFIAEELDYTDVTNPDLAKNTLTLAKELNLKKFTAPIQEGNAVFEDVAPGLYVVFQDAEDATEGFAAINPFLISMPKFQDNEYVTEVVAEPKVPLETVPPTTVPPSTKPKGEEAPKTGQLNWPVPVLAVSGAVLFIAGFVMWTGRKRA